VLCALHGYQQSERISQLREDARALGDSIDTLRVKDQERRRQIAEHQAVVDSVMVLASKDRAARRTAEARDRQSTKRLREYEGESLDTLRILVDSALAEKDSVIVACDAILGKCDKALVETQAIIRLMEQSNDACMDTVDRCATFKDSVLAATKTKGFSLPSFSLRTLLPAAVGFAAGYAIKSCDSPTIVVTRPDDGLRLMLGVSLGW
jgi:hypothetical protein